MMRSVSNLLTDHAQMTDHLTDHQIRRNPCLSTNVLRQGAAATVDRDGSNEVATRLCSSASEGGMKVPHG
jgi:hypothetical protein